MDKSAMTVYAWFHARGNALVKHNIIVLAHHLCALDCGFDLVVGDTEDGQTANQGRLGVNFNGLLPGNIIIC